MLSSLFASSSVFRSIPPNRAYRYMPLAARKELSIYQIYPKKKQDFSSNTQSQENTKAKFSGYIPVDELQITYSGSSGPGGQNVNKVNTKVDVRFHVATARWLPEAIRSEILQKNRTSVTKEGYLIVKSDKTRTQMLNLADCLDKIRKIILESVKSNEKDTPCKELEALARARHEEASRRRLLEKRHKSILKQDRETPNVDF